MDEIVQQLVIHRKWWYGDMQMSRLHRNVTSVAISSDVWSPSTALKLIKRRDWRGATISTQTQTHMRNFSTALYNLCGSRDRNLAPRKLLANSSNNGDVEEGMISGEDSLRKISVASSLEEEVHGDDDRLREECGVVGVFEDPEAAKLCYLALHALQHRGQEGAGIVSANEGTVHAVTGMGLVSDVFDQEKMATLPGTAAIGHVRYATAGASVLKNVQPFVCSETQFGSIALAHNGNLVNYSKLKTMLQKGGSSFNTTSDTEVVLHLIKSSKRGPLVPCIIDACEQLEGAYSFVFLSEDKVVAVRDPLGFRPLVMGRRPGGAYIFASETCALDIVEAEYVREVQPGEVVVVDKHEGESSFCLLPHKERKACIFEHIYFSSPSSIVFGRSVYESRYKYGRLLAKEAPVPCDVVIAVPDSGNVAALGYADEAQVPFHQGLIRSHYVGRTFIEPSQKLRDFGVKLKLTPVSQVLKNKRVVIVDDSIVRETTSMKIVRLIKASGAAEVHMRIASPPITGSCYYGVDTPRKDELISHRLNVDDTRKAIGADSLAFLPLDKLQAMLAPAASTFCYACMSGIYPTSVDL